MHKVITFAAKYGELTRKKKGPGLGKPWVKRGPFWGATVTSIRFCVPIGRMRYDFLPQSPRSPGQGIWRSADGLSAKRLNSI